MLFTSYDTVCEQVSHWYPRKGKFYNYVINYVLGCNCYISVHV